MMIAAPVENEEVFQHFGHTKAFALYQVEENKIVSKKAVSADGNGHGALAGFLSGLGVQVLICGGIGGGAVQALEAEKIQIFAGVTGLAEQAVSDYLEGNLRYQTGANCNHHGDGRQCGGHQ